MSRRSCRDSRDLPARTIQELGIRLAVNDRRAQSNLHDCKRSLPCPWPKLTQSPICSAAEPGSWPRTSYHALYNKTGFAGTAPRQQMKCRPAQSGKVTGTDFLDLIDASPATQRLISNPTV